MTEPRADEEVTRAIDLALRDVIDPCCRDRGISVVDMGLVAHVEVTDRRAHIELMLTSGWCPFQVDLTGEVAAAAEGVEGIDEAEVRITLQQVWSPERMAPGARAKLRLLPDPEQAGDRDEWLSAHPAPSSPLLLTIPSRTKESTP